MKFSFLLGALNQLFIHQLPKTLIVQFLFFLGYLVIKMPQFIDVSYAFSFLFTVFMIISKNLSDFSSFNDLKTMVFFGFILLWSIRLGGYIIYARLFPFQIDPRYVDLASFTKHKKLFMLSQFFGQGVGTLVIALPLYFLFTQDSKEFTVSNILGLLISIFGFGLWTLADYQLYQFKKSVNWDRKKVFRGGLFKNARHPNLLGDIIIWTGLAVAGLDMSNLMGTIWGFVGPFTLWFVMNFFTIPATTRELMRTKPNYGKVIHQTNKFIPF